MTFKNLAEAVDEKLAAIVPVLARIEQIGGSADLRDLGRHLIDAMNLFQRNPGIEAAADDLYGAAGALVTDSTVRAQPIARQLRLLKEAHLRFSSRLVGAVERAGRYEHLVVPAFPVRRAA
ncbi:hypothetical protein [Microvirga aerophila]|uniref:Uncharacterized protein n=1 Tax=Microvirga aerophila TaxID=670291 RepID=A0A512BQ32_9HYPH|nr:hypothetical protein [Microvirga aerophila]GEO14049.1 hypothetical protein MAE02_17450 [Microvirga aerophila]